MWRCHHTIFTILPLISYKEIINLASNSSFRLIDPKTCIQNMHHSDVKYIYDHYLFKNLLARELGSDAEDSLYKALCQDKKRLVSIEYQAAQKEASAELRLAIKQTLTNIVLQTSAQAKIEQEVFGQESTISKGLIYVGAFMQGIGSSVWGLATWVKEVSDVVNPVVIAYNSFKAATASYGNDNQFSDELLKLQYRELVQALGFDPSQISQEQLKTAFETLEVVWADNDLKKRLTVFCKEYAQAQHSITITNVAGSAVFEIALAVIILAATGGAGLMPAFASKGHLIRSFNKLGDLLLTFGKQNKKPHAQHNPWQEQRHNKPAGTYSLADAQTESAKLFNITNPAKQKITCPIINVPCFNVVKTKSAKKNAKRLIEENYPEGSANLTPKSYLQQELDRQLADQEAALNEMSVAEYLEGRELFTNNKRGNKSTQGARNRFREDLIDDGQEKFQNDPNLSKAEIEAKATERADRIIKHLAALHNPEDRKS